MNGVLLPRLFQAASTTVVIPRPGPAATPGWAKGYIPSAPEWNNWWSNKLDLSGGTLTGSLHLWGDPLGPLEPVTRQYFEANAGTFAPVQSFNTRTGAIVLTSSDIAVAGGALATNTNNPNLLINSGFLVNQRGYSSGVALAANAYGHDRWKGGVSGCTYTFAIAQGVSTQITITAGSLMQIVEQAALQSATYVLSWTGTALGRVGMFPASGAYAASPITFVASLSGNVNVEFGTGTLSQVKLELGNTPTIWRPYTSAAETTNCQRFYWQAPFVVPVLSSIGATITFPVLMRTNPSVVGGGSGFTFTALSQAAVNVSQTTSATQTLIFNAEL